jgi:ActR/RegA family two-component response regulator
MLERKKLFVLVVENDQVVAATLATVLHAGGYMVATTGSHATAMRIASRMVVDAAVINVPANQHIDMETAAALQHKYPECRILLVCSPAHVEAAIASANEIDIETEVLARPLSGAKLLAQLATAPGVSSPTSAVYGGSLQAA